MRGSILLIALATIATRMSVITAQFMSPFGPNSNCTLLPNKDRVGFELNHANGQTSDCNKLAMEWNAATWTWSNHNGGMCWLKSHIGPLVDKEGYTATDCVDTSVASVCSTFDDVDFVGADIGNKPAKAFDECCDICNATPRCQLYTWSNYNGGTCWLEAFTHNTIAAPGVKAAGLVLLYGVCPLESGVDFIGNDIDNKPAKEAGLCCEMCRNNGLCNAFTWTNYNGGTCWFKSAKGQTVKMTGAFSASYSL